MEILVQYSGGKDSQAALIWAVNKYGSKNVTAIFCDTEWEHKATYKHIKETCRNLGVKLIILKSKVGGMIGLAKMKKRFPSSQARFCTEHLKVIPFIDYVIDNCKDILVVQGIRADESIKRSKMQSQCTLFKYYFEPYIKNSIIVEHLEASNRKLTKRQEAKFIKAKKRLAEGKEDPKYHTYRKKEVIEFSKKYATDIIRPHFDKSSQYVIDFIIDNGQLPNPLYYMGVKRVGCWPCIMFGHNEMLQIIRRNPERIDEIAAIEIETGSSFFSPDYIPKYACSMVDKNGKKYPNIKDIEKYIMAKNATLNMFEDAVISCSSYYHLCE